jgi:hypothetical protein
VSEHIGKFQALVEQVFGRHSERMYAMSEPCLHCQEPLSNHAHNSENCPSPFSRGPMFLKTQFQALHGPCEASRSADPTGEYAIPCGSDAIWNEEFNGYFCSYCVKGLC